jgi:hypothetical protein
MAAQLYVEGAYKGETSAVNLTEKNSKIIEIK